MSKIEKVLSELRSARDKYPEWPTDPLHALAILGEEFGELTQAMLQLAYEPHKTSKAEVEREAIQTAAMALRLVTSLDRYAYSPSEQHCQSEEAMSTEQDVAGLEVEILRERLERAQIELCRQYALTHEAYDRDAVDRAQAFWVASVQKDLPGFKYKLKDS